MTAGWVQVKGGTHHCGLCHEFVVATKAAPVWRYYATATSSTACACGRCAEGAGGMSRWRLVDEQNGRVHVSTVVLAEDEIDEQLGAEAYLHRLAGWTVTEGDRVVVCRKRDTCRVIRAAEFDAMHDSPGVT